MNFLFQVMIKQECVRKSGYSVQADEEQLRLATTSSFPCFIQRLKFLGFVFLSLKKTYRTCVFLLKIMFKCDEPGHI